MQATVLIVRAFDGSRREVIGEVGFAICVGPHQFTITFQVMDIHPAYSFLLGRLWIHVSGAVTFTLHQKLNFMFGDKLIIVYGEKDFMISEFPSFWYFETEKGITEVPFHCLEFEDVNSTSINQSQSIAMVLSSTKSSKKTLEKGTLFGWGQIVKVAKKHVRFGLGYHPTSRNLGVKGCKKFNPVRFRSTGYEYYLSVAVMDGVSSNKQTIIDFVRKCPLGFKLDNWTTTIVPVVFS